ncbi:MAG: helicase C-terminal domain-containing protein [Anaerolineales bacterium]
MSILVALDIETTGLDPSRDAIIEIGAVRFRDHTVDAEWTTLINPGRPIPPFISQLTGIKNEMVARAPMLQDVYNDLLRFVGNAPVVGHNVRFDMGFLTRRGGLLTNPQVDTYELAAILMPGAQRYNLGALASALNIDLPATHRALDDTRVTHQLYLHLAQQAETLPIELLAELVKLSENLEWGARWTLQQALVNVQHQTKRWRKSAQAAAPQSGRAALGLMPPAPPLSPRDPPLPLNEDDVAALLEHGGAFSRYFPNFEYRPEQVGMLRAVTQAFSEGRHLMVEAGTGTGKSMAYLTPAALWALTNQTRVVISTNTINLQEQLIQKDIPDLANVLQTDLRAAVLKGRSNYLCPRRLEILRRRKPATADEMRIYAKVRVWQLYSNTGDKNEINLNGPNEREVWTRLSAEDEGCTAENCLKEVSGGCPFYRARQAAQTAHLLIVNHALLLSDIAIGNRILPEYQYLVIDEGHHLEDASTNALSMRVTQQDLERLMRELGSPQSGLFGRILKVGEEILTPQVYAQLGVLIEQATDRAFRFQELVRQFFVMLDQFLFEARQGRSSATGYAQQVRILPATRTQPAWMEVEISWDDADRSAKPLLKTLEELIKAASEMATSEMQEMVDAYATLTNAYRRLSEAYALINALIFKPDPGFVYWVESPSGGGRLTLQSAPLHIGSLMEEYLWHQKTSVVLTSATLTTTGDFDYMRQRLSAFDADELVLGSPYDYENSTLLYLANDIPEPNDRDGHQRAVEQGLLHLCRATGGRTLVLFTSYDQLRRTSRAIGTALNAAGIEVFEQGEGASSHHLLERFRTTKQGVLLGTRAFWEGVDVPGEALSVLVITKLPFDVPSDPIIAARSETFEDSFNQYSLPEAILRFRQGFGRLIRTQYDRGVVAIFDRRVLTKRYGKMFIDSLPTCTTRIAPLAELPRHTVQWLNL